MTRKHQAAFLFLLLAVTALQQSHGAGLLKCGGPTVDVRGTNYNVSPAIRDTGVGAFGEYYLRVNVMVAGVGVYRDNNGFASLRPGMTFKMIYKDGSRECGAILTSAGSVSAVPIEDTQRQGGTITVEDTSVYLQQFRPTGTAGIHGTYQICYDYYSNGELTATQCTVQVW